MKESLSTDGAANNLLLDTFNNAVNRIMDAIGQADSPVSFETGNYQWVDRYLQDNAARNEIAKLQADNAKTSALPHHKDDIKAALKSKVKELKKQRLVMLQESMHRYQQTGDNMLWIPSDSEIFNDSYFINIPQRTLVSLMFHNLTDKEIDEITANLQDGITEKDRQAIIEKNNKRIQKLEVFIKKELSPHDRWYFMPNGKHHAYPNGCKWTAMVSVWSVVAARASEPVNMFGHALSSTNVQAEIAAYEKLELNKTKKDPVTCKGYKPRKHDSAGMIILKGRFALEMTSSN
jgi:hypothetical protein